MTEQPPSYLTLRGLSESDPQALNEALHAVLESMEPLAYGDATTGLTTASRPSCGRGG